MGWMPPNYSGYQNSGSTTSYVPDACTGSDSDLAAPIAKYLANGEDAEVPAQCTNGGVTTAAPFTGSKNNCAAPIVSATPLDMPAAECIQTDETSLECVGKPSSPLAITATECIQTKDYAREDGIGKTSSPLATSAAECIQTKRQTRSLKMDLSSVYHGNFMQSCSENPCSNIGTGRSGDLAPRIGADNPCAGRCCCSDYRTDDGDSPDKSPVAIGSAARTKQKKHKRRTRHG